VLLAKNLSPRECERQFDEELAPNNQGPSSSNRSGYRTRSSVNAVEITHKLPGSTNRHSISEVAFDGTVRKIDRSEGSSFRLKRAHVLSVAALVFVVTATAIWWPEAVTNVTSESFIPHGFCFFWNKQLLALSVSSDSAIFLSYLAISLTLVTLVVRQRKAIPFAWIFVAFGLFIIACGFTHAMDVIVLWIPLYWLAADIKLITALASLTVAVVLPFLLPQVAGLIASGERSRRNEQRFLNATEGGYDSFFILESVRDVAGEIVDFRYAFVNANGAKLLSTTVDDLTGRLFCGTYPIYRTNGRFETFKRVCLTGQRHYAEYETADSSASAKWLRVQTLKLDDGVSVTASDISEHKEDEIKAVRLAMFLESIIASSPFATIVTDLSGAITSANPAAESMLRYHEGDLLGLSSPLMFFDSAELVERARRLSTELHQSVEPGIAVLVASEFKEWRLARKDGSFLQAEVVVRPLRAASGVVGLIVVAYDITERKANEDRIAHLAHHDALTGLPNRVLFRDRLEVALGRAKRERKKVAILLLDLDNFKRVNDMMGHSVGDGLLMHVAEQLRNSIRGSDTVARLGGDEFVLILDGLHTVHEAERIAEKLLTKLRMPLAIGTETFAPTASIGISLYPEDGDLPDDLLKNADSAMYTAKAEGRNSFKAFNYAMAAASSRKRQLEIALNRAFIADEFELLYQPQIDLATGLVTGVEALLRWRSNELGLVMPIEFIPLIEENGMIVPIGDWILRTACRDGRKLQLDVGRDLSIAVNISPRQFQQRGLPQAIRHALNESDLESKYLELEITESVLVSDSAKAMNILEEVRALHTCLAIDDFGTGFSSMSYIMRFPVDRIKIDKSFIRDITIDPSSSAVTTAIIALAKGLNIDVIAEGVETAEQRDLLIGRGCHAAQGYFFAKPCRIEEIPAAIRDVERSVVVDRPAVAG
jgi:diguanylate cyclase (GGDEF)-like protein/PAS domain S-box-containing protein